MTVRSPLGIGFVGCGIVTERGHLPGLRSLPTAKVLAVSDIDRNRLQRVADRFAVERRYPDFQALLEDPSIDIVAVCVPAQLHVQVATAVLDAGKHLFIEKPLALGLDEADRLIQHAARTSSRTMVGFNLRWHRRILEARTILRDGVLAPIELVRSTLTSGTQFAEHVPDWRTSRSTGGGEFLETAIHHFDLWRHLLQTEVEEVFAVSRSERWDDETVTVTARLANGVLATSVFSTCTSEGHELELYGRAGRLTVSLLGFGDVALLPSGADPRSVGVGLKGIRRAMRGFPQRAMRARLGGDYVLSYRDEWEHFVEAIRGDAPPESTLEDGRRALQVALAAIESASRGAPVRVDDAVRQVIPNAPRDLTATPN
jgi:myo-inositol 2-dehydrogenase/D-chiro-inositol 1-dehydrogenase